MGEEKLTAKQRKWLETSRAIGTPTITDEQKDILEKLYADMLPAEQQELQDYIRETYGKEIEESLVAITAAAEREWKEPSPGLRNALGKSQRVQPPPLLKKT